MLYNSEKDSLAKLAPRLTLKSCYPTILERQNVKLVLKVVHESTIAALVIQNEHVVQHLSATHQNLFRFFYLFGKSLMSIYQVSMSD